ncbi:carotenoid ester lipase precursor [Coniophora puteana RWD-64-598 SS2]|uniref:Carboxylic ester hydrolase n=1 Tax=Coniophora puteana (strain RWD-64-598) TaxID=741705 RepID=A0A5M3MS47_CONPW|nr:carotenoid ester lipase precursor [Coniophora puteana RWD-64-598 SS2]EIW81564.1 carotenoid ester lipase precursor [Coniophora puteana RWD-64-598 SS2]
MLFASSLLRAAPLLAVAALAGASPLAKRADPTVKLDNATVTGSASGSVNKFLGIPFAQPPTGNLRFQLPQPLSAYSTDFSATSFGPACPQQPIKLPIPDSLPQQAKDAINNVTNLLYDVITPAAEDCLTVNVVAPADATPDSKLPVIAWIFGGGFEVGGTSTYDGGVIVDRAIDLDVPAIYVSMNYRVAAFGFLASKEVKDAGVGNLGLQDQRLALQWIQQYIGAFGGDASKVTIWGESAGAISVALHMLTNGGDTQGLFRGAFMNSGSPIPVGDITEGQQYYDYLVDQTGCSGASDTLDCLRGVDYDELMKAVGGTPFIFSYQSLVLAWLPRVDGVFLKDDPQNLVTQGSVANVPFISGDCDDEGTLFSFSTLNVTSDDQWSDYLQTIYLPKAPGADISQLATLYPSDLSDGSPFNTGIANALTPEFKRLAAFQGDAVFQAPRRYFMQAQSGKQPMWSFINKRLKAIPFVGSFHGSDLLNVFFGGDMTDYVVRFAANLDPNGDTGISWPKYTTDAPNMLAFQDGFTPQAIEQDNYRVDAMQYLANVTLQFPI